MKRVLAAFAVSASLSLLSAIPAHAQGAAGGAAKGEAATQEAAGGCDSFTWDVSHELDVLGKPASTVTAGTDVKKPLRLDLDRHYAAKLAPQSAVHVVTMPGKSTPAADAHAGVFSFHTPKAGRYRISISTDHWLDVLDGGLIVVSSDFQGQRGCEKVHKIVQFELSGNKDFVLQLSGGTQASVDLAITQVKTS